MDFNNCACSGKSLGKLLRPAILSFLRTESLHGYVIVQKLGQLQIFKDHPPDVSGVYRTLHTMETEALVTATWDIGDSGPAKRKYQLTEKGVACHAKWHATLERYVEQVKEVLQLLDQ
jgi:poly-beta-hydroxybutyrate-responsive repressor